MVKVAPSVIRNLSPAIGAVFKAANGKGEATFSEAAPQPSGRKGLAPKRSFGGLRGGQQNGHRDGFLGKVQDWDANRSGN